MRWRLTRGTVVNSGVRLGFGLTRISGETRDYGFVTTMSINNSESYIDMDVVQWRQT